MKSRIIIMAAIAGLCVALGADDLLAQVRGPGGRGPGNGTCIYQQGLTNHPAGLRRRDGTFLTTGTTANGATTRPGYGRGLRDGSCWYQIKNTTTPPAPAK